MLQVGNRVYSEDIFKRRNYFSHSLQPQNTRKPLYNQSQRNQSRKNSVYPISEQKNYENTQTNKPIKVLFNYVPKPQTNFTQVNITSPKLKKITLGKKQFAKEKKQQRFPSNLSIQEMQRSEYIILDQLKIRDKNTQNNIKMLYDEQEFKNEETVDIKLDSKIHLQEIEKLKRILQKKQETNLHLLKQNHDLRQKQPQRLNQELLVQYKQAKIELVRLQNINKISKMRQFELEKKIEKMIKSSNEKDIQLKEIKKKYEMILNIRENYQNKRKK